VTRIAGMAAAKIAHGGILKRGTSHGLPEVVEIEAGTASLGKGISGNNMGGTSDTITVANGGPKSASTPLIGRSNNLPVFNCNSCWSCHEKYG